MMAYFQLIFLSLAGGIFSLIGGSILLSRRNVAEKLANYATPFAAGALLAAVFLDLLKDGLEETSIDTVLLAALIGMVIFFFAERFLHWFHHHHQHEGEDVSKPLIIVGDTLHNAMDGIAIAAAFMLSPASAVVTTIAVAAHEIPQEIGDFALLLSKGMRRRNVLLVNIVSALATVVAALVTYWLGSADILPLGFLLGLSAGFLLYIAASDIIPDIHEHTPKHKLLDWRALSFLAGIILVGISVQLAHRYIEAESSHGVVQEANHTVDHDLLRQE